MGEEQTTATLASDQSATAAVSDQEGQTGQTTSGVPTAADLRAQIEALSKEKQTLLKEREDARAQARGQQTSNAKLQAQLKEREDLKSELAALREGMLVLGQQTFGVEDDTPTETPYQRFKQRLTSQLPKTQPAPVAPPKDTVELPPEAQTVLQQVTTLASEAGFDINAPPDSIKAIIEDASDFFTAGKWAKSEKKVTEAIEVFKKAREKTSLEERRAEGGKKADALQGLASDMPRSSGSGGKPTFTTSQIKDRAFWEKNKAAILEAQGDGRIIGE